MSTVHVVDDDLATIRPIAEALKQAGHAVRAHRGLQSYLTLELDRAQRPDVIVCDLLPARETLEKTCAALVAKGAGHPVRIINVCSEAGIRALPKEDVLRKHSVVATLAKPARPVVLVEVVARVMTPSDPLTQKPTAVVESLLNEVSAIDPAKKKSIASIALKQVMAPMRSQQRFDADFECTFASKEEYLKEFTQNISRGGLYVRTENPPAARSIVSVTLRLPEQEETLSIKAEVVHVVPKGPGVVPGFGARIADDDRTAVARWHKLVEGVERSRTRGRGPKVMLLGFSVERAVELVTSAGLLSRADIGLIPLQTWTTVQMELARAPETKKLLILDATNEDTLARLFDINAIKTAAAMQNVTVACVGKAADARVPDSLNVIRAGDLANADLVGAITNWLDLPVRTQLRVPLATAGELRANGLPTDCRLLDISLLGVRLVTSENVRSSQIIELSFVLPGGDKLSRLRAEVRWTKPENGRLMCGARLLLEDREAEQRGIDAFIESQAQVLRSFDALRGNPVNVEEKQKK